MALLRVGEARPGPSCSRAGFQQHSATQAPVFSGPRGRAALTGWMEHAGMQGLAWLVTRAGGPGAQAA